MMFMEYKINFSIGIAGRLYFFKIGDRRWKPKDTVNAIRKIKKNKDDALLLYEHNYKETSMKFPRWKNKELDIENINNRIWLTLEEEKKKKNSIFLMKTKRKIKMLKEQKNNFK
ncbi:hypothetical protein HZH68_000998 [Vespula germanica]|uniref:Uncharacterized protein n=1 Tax=Vespula germanica TaxID=30212 RepID=A0A834NUL1_VESGE|nr:hypothetical protein HZH68_000998 [Vespula germanica]